jgi:hypothetical protein
MEALAAYGIPEAEVRDQSPTYKRIVRLGNPVRTGEQVRH